MRGGAVAVALTFLAVACAGEVATDRADRDAPVKVEVSGSVVRAGRVGAAARFSVADDRARGPIELELSFIDAHRRTLATTRDSVPFCGAGGSCWWGASFFAEEYGGKRIARVGVEVVGADPFTDNDASGRFEVRRGSDGAIRGEAPQPNGIAYVIASVDGAPRWGTSVNLTDDPTAVVPRDLLPPLDGEELTGYFYTGSAPTGH